MREVITRLPDHATLGDLIRAAQENSQMAAVLDIFSVQELIDVARARPKLAKNGGKKPGEIQFDEDGNPILELDAGPKVIRRRADVPDGDLRVLRMLAEHGAQREGDLANRASLTSDQLRIILRHLRSKGFVHIEGSGTKRRLKITRHGSGHLRKMSNGS